MFPLQKKHSKPAAVSCIALSAQAPCALRHARAPRFHVQLRTRPYHRAHNLTAPLGSDAHCEVCSCKQRCGFGCCCVRCTCYSLYAAEFSSGVVGLHVALASETNGLSCLLSPRFSPQRCSRPVTGVVHKVLTAVVIVVGAPSWLSYRIPQPSPSLLVVMARWPHCRHRPAVALISSPPNNLPIPIKCAQFLHIHCLNFACGTVMPTSCRLALPVQLKSTSTDVTWPS